MYPQKRHCIVIFICNGENLTLIFFQHSASGSPWEFKEKVSGKKFRGSVMQNIVHCVIFTKTLDFACAFLH